MLVVRINWCGPYLYFLSPQLDASFSLRDHRYGANVSHGVSVYSPAFAGTHCAYPQRDGQAELTWVAGYIPRALPVHRWSPIQALTEPDVE